MRKIVLLGIGRFMLPIPRFIFEREINKTQPKILQEEYNQIRDFVVKEIPALSEPISPTLIAEALDLPQNRVTVILDALEKNLTYLWRGDGTNVTWAYPVTVDETPHRYTLNTGETGHAA